MIALRGVSVVFALLSAASIVAADPYEDVRSLLDQCRIPEAESAAATLVEQMENRYGPESLEAARAMDLLAEAWHLHWKAPDGSVERMERVVATKRTVFGDRDPEVAKSLVHTARLLKRRQRPEEALELLFEALAIREDTFGPDDPIVASTLDPIGWIQGATLERFGEARDTLERALEIKETQLGPQHPDVGFTLRYLGDLADITGDFERAEPLLRRAVLIREQAARDPDPVLANRVNNLALVLDHLGRYDEAKDGFRRAAELWERAFGPDHPAVAAGLGNYAKMLVRLDGDYSAARAIKERLLEIFSAWYGHDHPFTAFAYTSLANDRRDAGEYHEALDLIEEALAIHETVHGPDHRLVGQTLIVASGIRERLQDLDGAERDLRRALRIFEDAFGSDDFLTHAASTNLADLLLERGDPGRARVMYERAARTADTIFPPDSAERSYFLHGLARAVFAESGDVVRAERLHTEALELREAALAPDNPLIAASLEQLAELLRVLGRLDEAAVHLRRAAEIRRRAQGTDSVDHAAVLGSLARIESMRGHHDEAIELALRSERVVRRQLQLVARCMTEEQILPYARSRRASLDRLLSFSVAAGKKARPDLARETWEALAASRATVLDAIAWRNRLLHGSSDPELRELANTWWDRSRRLANAVVRGPGPMAGSAYRELVERLETETLDAERALARRVARFGEQVEIEQAEMGGYLEELRRGDAIVSFTRYRDGDERLLAFVARPETDAPEWIELGEADRIDGLVARWRESVSQGLLLDDYRAVGELLREAVWDPVADRLIDVDRVFVVPDGSLHLVNFATLPIDADRYLVEDARRIHSLGTERDVLRPPDHSGAGALLALGGIDYDLAPGGKQDRAATTFRGPRPDCRSFRSRRFEPLPASLREIDTIEAIWRETHDAAAPISKRTGADATERAFKRQAPGQGIVHLATHGFVIDDACSTDPREGTRGFGQVTGGAPPVVEDPGSEIPLRLSGLALAGANRRAEAGEGDEDGILTAEEIATLDLADASWVVLSACNTGVGTVHSGEGVFGLRRAFQVAGARTLIMSLWPVEDRAAADWMGALYEARFRDGLSTSGAVRKASLRMLQDLRDSDVSTHPFYWGAFVATGDWR